MDNRESGDTTSKRFRIAFSFAGEKREFVEKVARILADRFGEDKILYDKSAYDNDLANQRKVRYQYSGDTYKTIPRDVLSEAFQRRLRVRGSTVSDLYEFKDEIEKLFSQDNYSWTSDFEDKENELKGLLKTRLLNKIRSGKSSHTAENQ